MYTVTRLGTDSAVTEGASLNAEGHVVGGAGGVADPRGTVWSGYSGAAIAHLPEHHTWLSDITDDGDAVGVRKAWSDAQEAILFRNGTMTDLGSIVGGTSWATAVNEQGTLCGWRKAQDGTFSAFLYDYLAGALQQIDPLPGKSNVMALAINDIGYVVGQSEDHAFLRTADGQLIDLGPGIAQGINNLGQIVGASTASGASTDVPTMWDASSGAPVQSQIPLPPGFASGSATSINEAGEVVGSGYKSPSGGDQYAFVFSGGVSADLNTLITGSDVADWTLNSAGRINQAGQIAGTGTYGRPGEAVMCGYCLTPVRSPIRGGLTLGDLAALLIFGGVVNDGGGLVVLGSGAGVHVGPWGPPDWSQLQVAKRDAIAGLALDEMARHLQDPAMRETVRRAALEGVRQRVDALLQSPNAGARAPRRL